MWRPANLALAMRPVWTMVDCPADEDRRNVFADYIDGGMDLVAGGFVFGRLDSEGGKAFR
jgi:hypothetical protein